MVTVKDFYAAGFSLEVLTPARREIVNQHWDRIADLLHDDSYRTRGK